MKLKQTIILTILIFSTFISCSRQPKCGDKDVKKLVVETIKRNISATVEKTFNDELNKNAYKYEEFRTIFATILEERETLISELEFKIYEIKPVRIDKEIKKCECEGTINAVEKSDIIANVENEYNKTESYKYNIVGIKPKLKYSTILTDENLLFVNILNAEALDIYSQNIMLKLMYKAKEKISVLNGN